MAYKLFGFTFVTPWDVDQREAPSVVPPANDTGAVTIYDTARGVYDATTLDLDAFAQNVNDIDLIGQYRDLALQPEIDEAIGDIINELIIRDDDEMPISIDVDDLPEQFDDTIRQQIRDEFDHILHLLNFKRDCYQIVRQWYVDGRLYYDVIIDKNRAQLGIVGLRNVDPRTIRPVRELRTTPDAATGVTLTEVVDEYYVYNKDGFRNITQAATLSVEGIKLTNDRIVHINSGIYTPGNVTVLSNLHKAIKPFNQLRMIEDASVIYRITRAPERRVFYVDVGDMPTTRVDSYLNQVATKYRNKMVFDSVTGQVKDDRKIQSMQEDFFLPRRSNGRGTEVQTLPGGTNLGEMTDVEYFRRKLYKSLNIPLSRLEANQGQFTIGRATEITRDEIKFNRFLSHLRARFSQLFDELMCRHLTMRGVLRHPDQWTTLRKYIKYDYVKDSHFAELKDLEILTSRLNVLQQAEPFIGKFFSNKYVQDRILRLSAEDVAQIQQDISMGDQSAGDVGMGGGMGDPGADTVEGDLPVGDAGNDNPDGVEPDTGGE